MLIVLTRVKHSLYGLGLALFRVKTLFLTDYD